MAARDTLPYLHPSSGMATRWLMKTAMPMAMGASTCTARSKRVRQDQHAAEPGGP